jgi:plastocyanin
MRARNRLTALGAVLALAAVVLPGSPAAANHGATLTIPVGQYLDADGGPPAESMRFFPDEVTVHRGDTLKFVGEFHTATFLPSDVTDADAWVAEEASSPDDPYAFLKSNPDHAQFPLKLLGDNPFMPRTDCGSVDNPCEYDGSSVVDSGALLSYIEFSETGPPTVHGFSVTVEAAPGESIWVVCRMHPGMRMKINVVQNNVDTTTQETVDTYTANTVAADRAEASLLHENLSTTHASHMDGGTKVWEAYGGYDTENFSLLAMYPRKLKIKKGQRVEWQFPLHHEAHTVTLSGKKAKKLAFSAFAEVCDPNGDDEAGGEVPVTSFPPTCSAGVHESLVGGRLISPTGDGVVRGVRDLESSGARTMGLSLDPYNVKFAKRTTRKGLMYLCAIHPFMRGRVSVR